MWETYKKGFKAYLQLERSLADNSVQAYGRDMEIFTQWMQEKGLQKSPKEIVLKDLQQFIKWISVFIEIDDIRVMPVKLAIDIRAEKKMRSSRSMIGAAGPIAILKDTPSEFGIGHRQDFIGNV